MNIARRLMGLKDTAEEAKQKEAEAKGALEQLNASLKDFECDSIEEAETKVEKMEAKNKKTAQELEDGVRELEEVLNV